ncbi:MAG: hypothetical protein ACI86M_000336 [Saprospiraceae bacterium]|jgi:hypothetical protein
MMTMAYSKTPLAKKLGIKSEAKVLFINHPSHYFDLFEDLPSDIEILKGGKVEEIDFIHLFVKSKEEFVDRYHHVKPLLKRDGLLWVSWPKGKSKIETNLNQDYIRGFILNNGLVDVKVCSIDDDWSALKFVYRVMGR